LLPVSGIMCSFVRELNLEDMVAVRALSANKVLSEQLITDCV